jgi:hypothetical protein
MAHWDIVTSVHSGYTVPVIKYFEYQPAINTFLQDEIRTFLFKI